MNVPEEDGGPDNGEGDLEVKGKFKVIVVLIA